MPGGLTKEGTEALDQTLARHVGEKNSLPGLVALVARGDDVHVAALGHKAFGDPEPIGRDAIFRIASISKPIAGVAAMLLIQDGAMASMTPSTAGCPSSRRRGSCAAWTPSLDDTVPAERPITVEDILSFHLGFGSIMIPGPFPVQQAEQRTGPEDARAAVAAAGPHPGSVDRPPGQPAAARPAGEPVAVQHRRDGGRRAHRAGRGRAAGRGAARAGLRAARDGRHRLLRPGRQAGPLHHVLRHRIRGGGPRVLDRPDGWWAAPPKFPDASGALVSTVDDLYAFASMLAADGRPRTAAACCPPSRSG